MNLMGVDLGIHKVSTFTLDAEVPHVAALDFAPIGAPRAMELHALSTYVRSLAALHGVDQVWIEDTLIGNNRKYSLQLTEVKGAVMAELGTFCDVRLVNVGTWKAQVVGNGNASKDMVRDYIHVTHGAYAPLCGDDQDLYDAACVALYGLQINERAAQLDLAT